MLCCRQPPLPHYLAASLNRQNGTSFESHWCIFCTQLAPDEIPYLCCCLQSGASLGTLSICPLNEWLTESYGLQGYFLIFSGVLLNICVASMLMRPPPKDEVSNAPQTRVTELGPPDEESDLVEKNQSVSRVYGDSDSRNRNLVS